MKKGEPYTFSLPYAPEQVFEMIADIASYPDFLPWCTGARIRDQSSNIVTADLIIGYGVVRETFTSRVILTPHTSIHVDYVKGPMNHLETIWSFKSSEDGRSTEIKLCVDFEFKNFLLRRLMTSVFDHAFASLSEAFTERAHALYGANALLSMR